MITIIYRRSSLKSNLYQFSIEWNSLACCSFLFNQQHQCWWLFAVLYHSLFVCLIFIQFDYGQYQIYHQTIFSSTNSLCIYGCIVRLVPRSAQFTNIHLYICNCTFINFQTQNTPAKRIVCLDLYFNHRCRGKCVCAFVFFPCRNNV